MEQHTLSSKPVKLNVQRSVSFLGGFGFTVSNDIFPHPSALAREKTTKIRRKVTHAGTLPPANMKPNNRPFVLRKGHIGFHICEGEYIAYTPKKSYTTLYPLHCPCIALYKPVQCQLSCFPGEPQTLTLNPKPLAQEVKGMLRIRYETSHR